MQRRMLIPLILLALVIVYWVAKQHYRKLPEAYVGERSATLWSSVAQVRQPLATLHYGDKVSLVSRRGEQANVRTLQGLSGWLEARLLIEPALWQRGAELLAKSHAMPVQARGRTKKLSNLRVEPGRSSARIYQFSRGIPVEILARAVSEWAPPPGEQSQSGVKEPEEGQKTRREDWLFVRGQATSIVGLGGAGTPKPEDIGAPSKEQEPVPVAGW